MVSEVAWGEECFFCFFLLPNKFSPITKTPLIKKANLLLPIEENNCMHSPLRKSKINQPLIRIRRTQQNYLRQSPRWPNSHRVLKPSERSYIHTQTHPHTNRARFAFPLFSFPNGDFAVLVLPPSGGFSARRSSRPVEVDAEESRLWELPM